MEIKFKYHPLVEGLKVNEDGTEVIWNGKLVKQVPINDGKNFIMKVKGKNVSRLKVVCEAWNGLADTPELIATKIDADGGGHYTNLVWRKRGQGISHKRAESFKKKYIFNSLEQVQEFISKKPDEIPMKVYCKENGVSESAVYNAQKRYGKN